MSTFENRGGDIRNLAKQLVLEYLHNHPDGHSGHPGVKQAEVARGCGLVWGDYAKATNSNQQYWTVALLRELEAEAMVEQVRDGGPWRLCPQS